MRSTLTQCGVSAASWILLSAIPACSPGDEAAIASLRAETARLTERLDRLDDRLQSTSGDPVIEKFEIADGAVLLVAIHPSGHHDFWRVNTDGSVLTVGYSRPDSYLMTVEEAGTLTTYMVDRK